MKIINFRHVSNTYKRIAHLITLVRNTYVLSAKIVRGKI